MHSFPILSVAIWLPIVFGLLVLAVGSDQNPGPARWVALIGSILGLLVTIPLITGFDSSTAALQFVEQANWIERFNITYHLGVDGISMWFVVLTALITVIVVIAGWEVITERVAQYFAAFLILSGIMVGVFSTADGMLFYVFFEATLIPMYIIIGVWGGPNRVYAAFKFFLYTLMGSLLMLIALLYLYTQTHTFDLATWQAAKIGFTPQVLLFIAFFLAFAVKVPMWPVHTWLPDAHVEAPTGGSVVLAAIMLKLGAYGFLRFSLPIAPDASHFLAPVVITLSLIAVIYIGLVALVQTDMKKLVAYSSIAHMGFVTLGFFIFSQLGVEGAIIQMISHGFVSGAMFLSIGVLYDRVALAPDRGLRRRREHDAEVRRVLDALRDGQLRPAGHVGFRRRVHGDSGGREVQLLDRFPRDVHADSRRGLHAVDVQARALRRDRERPRREAQGHQQARNPDACRARDLHAVHGPVSEALHRRDARIRGKPPLPRRAVEAAAHPVTSCGGTKRSCKTPL